MKKFLSMAALLAAFTFNASAYDPTSVTVPTVTADGAVSNSIAGIIDVTRQSTVSLAWTTTSSNVTVRVSASVDRANWETNRFVLQLGASTTTGAARTTTTNLNVGGLGWLRIDSVLNTGSLGATNTVKYGEKPGI